MRLQFQDILDIWLERVRIEMRASEYSNKISLQDHLPNILEGIILLLEKHDSSQTISNDNYYKEIIHNSREHGRHRATTEFYTINEIVKEYIVFNQVINDVLRREGVKELNVYLLLSFLIENAILESTVAFSDALREVQEKFIGTLAHDLRNPLSAARLAVEMQNHDLSKERFLKIKSMISNSINKAINMTERFLEHIHVKAGEGIHLNFTEVDIVPELKTVFLEAKEIYEEEIIFKNHYLEKLTGIFDATALRRVLENLLNNALKYGDSRKPITILLEENHDNMILSVHNFGLPIEENTKNKIFDFLSHGSEIKKNRLQSWGMGLTLVKMVVEGHHGKINLISSENSGTKFEVTIPKYMNSIGQKRTKISELSKNKLQVD